MKATIHIDIACEADDAYFEDEIPQWVIDELELSGPIPCEGTGIGSHCVGCRFCVEFNEIAEQS